MQFTGFSSANLDLFYKTYRKFCKINEELENTNCLLKR